MLYQKIPAGSQPACKLCLAVGQRLLKTRPTYVRGTLGHAGQRLLQRGANRVEAAHGFRSQRCGFGVLARDFFSHLRLSLVLRCDRLRAIALSLRGQREIEIQGLFICRSSALGLFVLFGGGSLFVFEHSARHVLHGCLSAHGLQHHRVRVSQDRVPFVWGLFDLLRRVAFSFPHRLRLEHASDCRGVALDDFVADCSDQASANSGPIQPTAARLALLRQVREELDRLRVINGWHVLRLSVQIAPQHGFDRVAAGAKDAPAVILQLASWQLAAAEGARLVAIIDSCHAAKSAKKTKRGPATPTVPNSYTEQRRAKHSEL